MLYLQSCKLRSCSEMNKMYGQVKNRSDIFLVARVCRYPNNGRGSRRVHTQHGQIGIILSITRLQHSTNANAAGYAWAAALQARSVALSGVTRAHFDQLILLVKISEITSNKKNIYQAKSHRLTYRPSVQGGYIDNTRRSACEICQAPGNIEYCSQGKARSSDTSYYSLSYYGTSRIIPIQNTPLSCILPSYADCFLSQTDCTQVTALQVVLTVLHVSNTR